MLQLTLLKSLFKIWIWLEQYPTQEAQIIFSFRMSSQTLFHVKIRVDGQLELWSHGQPPPGAVTKSSFPRSQWFHIAVVYYPHRGPHPNLRPYRSRVSSLSDHYNRILCGWRSY